MHTPRLTRPIGPLLFAIALVAALAVTAGPAAANDNRASTRTSLTATPSASSVGQAVTLKATVTFVKVGNRLPTGPVYLGATNGHTSVYLGSASVTGCSLATTKCTATLVTTKLPKGKNAVAALYNGDKYFKPSAGLTSATVTAVAPAPGAPSLTSATAGDGQVALQWSAPTTGGPVSTYNVYRSGTQGEQGGLIASGLTGTTYTDVSATNDSTYYYSVTAANGGGQSAPSSQLSARPPSSSATTCSSGVDCDSPTVTSSDDSTSLHVTSDPAAVPQTLTLQVGGLSAMQCTLPESGSVVSAYHTTATDAGKIAYYTVFNVGENFAADFANNFYAVNGTDISGCYGSPDAFIGYSPDGSEGSNWADGPYAYGPAPFNEGTQLYEAFLGSCANNGGYMPCFYNINGGTYNTTEVHSPASASDPRVSH